MAKKEIKFSKNRILVTGGVGFIGSHIVDACLEKGNEVFSVDDMSFGRKENLNPEAKNFKVDISDFLELEKVFKKARPEIIFHSAALARIQSSFQNPDRYFQVNALGTRNILMLAKKFGAKKIIYSSSSSAYGIQEKLPVCEELAVSPQALNPYASTKRIGEMLMRDLGEAAGGPKTVCLRYFNVYGPRQVPGGAYATAVAIFLDQMRKNKPLTIVPDGHQRRDFTWIGDIVKANLLAASSKVGGGEIINIGSGKNYSIWEIAGLILGLGKNVDPKKLLSEGRCVMAPARQGEVRMSLADISKAKKLLGWEPEFNFEEGIKILLKQGLSFD